MLLLSDGSVTRHLELLTGTSVEVDCFDMRVLEEKEDPPPLNEALVIRGPLIQRQVLLRAGNEVQAYAASWWCAETVDGFLRDRKIPIWTSLSASKTELYREVHGLHRGIHPKLESEFQRKGPFWGRHYTFHHDGKPLTVIYEVFSPSLERHLGPGSPRNDR